MSANGGIQAPEAAGRFEDRLADFTRDRRMVVLSGMALVVGAASAVVAYALVKLIESKR